MLTEARSVNLKILAHRKIFICSLVMTHYGKAKICLLLKIREILVICLDVRKIHKLTNTL